MVAPRVFPTRGGGTRSIVSYYAYAIGCVLALAALVCMRVNLGPGAGQPIASGGQGMRPGPPSGADEVPRGSIMIRLPVFDADLLSLELLQEKEEEMQDGSLAEGTGNLLGGMEEAWEEEPTPAVLPPPPIPTKAPSAASHSYLVDAKYPIPELGGEDSMSVAMDYLNATVQRLVEDTKVLTGLAAEQTLLSRSAAEAVDTLQQYDNERAKKQAAGLDDRGFDALLRRQPLPGEAEVAAGQGKVAFLFLCKHASIHTEPLWELFFAGVPKHLYTIVTHPAPGETFNATSSPSGLFVGSEASDRVKVEWGQMSVVTGEVRLLQGALKDPAVGRFILASESNIPIRDFHFVYNYLFSSNQSFIESFPNVQAGRYHENMAPHVTKDQFRKGGQWFALKRDHAELVVRGTGGVHDVFYKWCYWSTIELPQRLCAGDETYVQTLLNVEGLADQVIPRSLTFTEWWPVIRSHPKTFFAQHVNYKTFKAIQSKRRVWNPKVPPELHVAAPNEMPEGRGFSGGQIRPERFIDCFWNGQPSPCFLFARKFTPKAAGRVLRYSLRAGLNDADAICPRKGRRPGPAPKGAIKVACDAAAPREWPAVVARSRRLRAGE